MAKLHYEKQSYVVLNVYLTGQTMGHGTGHGKLGFDGAGNARFTGSELLCLICKKVKAENQPHIKKKDTGKLHVSF